MNMNFQTYYSKVKGCYLGKNIGGTLGAPFECYRGVYDVDGFMQDVSNPIPNDDVDLQLVWLSAAEHEGRRLDATVLAEYWNTFVSSVISEYGTGKNNFNMGILPPLSGHMRNVNRDSNGAWIRTEIWACLCAGNPALAANYAYYDASVDHSGEGVNAAVFVAAVESAAFFESDVDQLLDIGLSYLPAECGVRTAVDLVRRCYRQGDDWKTVRIKLFQAVPSSFGEMGGVWRGTQEVPACRQCPAQEADPNIPKAVHGYDAPWSIGAIVLGWLYGEGDFGRSVCLATDCGEDTDCTAGTLGAILGIIAGAEKIPEKWSRGCSDRIAICTLRPDALLNVPKTIDELCARIVRQTPVFLERRCVMTEDGSYESPAHRAVCLRRKDVRRLHSGGFCGGVRLRARHRAQEVPPVYRADQLRRRSRGGEGRPDQKTENHRAEPALYAAVSHRAPARRAGGLGRAGGNGALARAGALARRVQRQRL